MIAIRLIISSSTSVSNPNMKKHFVGTSMDGAGGSYKPRGWGRGWGGGWVGKEVGGWGVGR